MGQISLLGVGEEAPPTETHRTRRAVERRPMTRSAATQIHLPILSTEDAEVARFEAFADTSAPLTRADCLAEARPCPWVRCRFHIYAERIEVFNTIVEAVSQGDGETLESAIARVVKSERVEGKTGLRWTAMGAKLKTPTGNIEFEKLESDHVEGPWPTCALDVADQVRLGGKSTSMADAAKLVGLSREGIRLADRRIAAIFVAHESLRPWIDEVVASHQAEVRRSERAKAREGVDHFGEREPS